MNWGMVLHKGLVSGLALFALVIGGIAAVVFLLEQRRQLDRLSRAAQRWGEGNLRHRIFAPTQSGETAEIGSSPKRSPGPVRSLESLARALDAMAESLQQRQESVRRHAEEGLIQAEKLATTGRLAAGVAHEINNPLGAILLYGDLLLESTPEDDPRRENMARIVTQAARAREIVRGLLDFARESPSQVSHTDLNRILQDALSLLERQPLIQRVRVRSELSPTPLWVRADGPKLQQVFINIIINALEAMREGGVLTLRSGYSERKGYCRVAISDTGYGIPEEHMPRLFEPFFTTKEVGHGVGLGLAISYGIVRQHHGEIEAQSHVGSGSTFRVLLPLDRGEA
jgi:two-component system, NtrC family, sensor kinase